MKITLALTALVGTSTVLADTISLGYLLYGGVPIQRAIWRNDQNICDWFSMGSGKCPEAGGAGACVPSSQLCDREYYLPANGKKYRFKNCGTNNLALHYYNSQTFISNARRVTFAEKCNGDPNFQTIKEWEFTCDKPGC